jgi:2-polyprenyl-3-methyl-5-hydroxy-6-metoxy-1,4-benzoquinol methylase
VSAGARPGAPTARAEDRLGTAGAAPAELRERVRRYYTAYYRDALGIADWPVLVDLRQEEERQEAARLERLARLVGSAALDGRVLNVGCGTGGFDAALARAHPRARVTGIDADAEAMSICALKRGAGAGAFARSVSEALPFRDGAFDLVYCFSSIEHVESVAATVREMVRVTRPGGAVYVHTPNAWSWYEGHYKLFWVPFLPRALARWASSRGPSRRPGCAICASTTTLRRASRAGRSGSCCACTTASPAPPPSSSWWRACPRPAVSERVRPSGERLVRDPVSPG